MTSTAPIRPGRSPQPRLGSETLTNGVRVTVHPAYSSLESDPSNNYFKFVYRIRIANESDRTVQLVSRHWIILDADGERQEVKGEGVVGQQPVLEPGQVFEYASFCPLGTPWGTMEGAYEMRILDRAGGEPTGESFKVDVGRFFLVSPRDAEEL